MRGLDSFKDHFGEFEDSYVIIGGVATFLLLKELDALKPKVTKDVDMVLFGRNDEKFLAKLKEYISLAEYKAEESKDMKKRYYRFVGPKSDTYPEMIELFVKNDENFKLELDQRVVPIDLEEDIKSLSAPLRKQVTLEYFSPCPPLWGNLVRSLRKPNLA